MQRIHDRAWQAVYKTRLTQGDVSQAAPKGPRSFQRQLELQSRKKRWSHLGHRARQLDQDLLDLSPSRSVKGPEP